MWPAVVLIVTLLATGQLLTQASAIRRERDRAVADVPLLAELVALGLAAGLPFTSALTLAKDQVAPQLRDEVEGMLRRARRRGLAAVLEATQGMAGSFYLRASRAQITGAPLALAIDAFVRDARHAERARHEMAARRLPVRLLLPLALLILPGFVLLTVGPAVVTALDRLQLPS